MLPAGPHEIKASLIYAILGYSIVLSGPVSTGWLDRSNGRLVKDSMMKIQNPEAKSRLVQRLKRIEGQVRGVEAMLAEERDCRDIMQQLSAIHSAIQGASRIFLQEYATACLAEMDEEGSPENGLSRRGKREKMIQDMIALLDKAP